MPPRKFSPFARSTIEQTGTEKGRGKDFHHILARRAMNIFNKSLATLTLAAIGILGFQSQAQAQFRPLVRPYTGQIQQIPSVQQTFPVNPLWPVAPGLNAQQYLYNQSVQAQAFNLYPPWAYGYNPYTPTVYQQNVVTPAYNYPVYPPYPAYVPLGQTMWPYYPR
jgi:hypothetical protein